MSENDVKRPRPVVFGCAGTRLSSVERGIFRDTDPFGFILFKRNCESPEQIRYLIQELQQSVGRDKITVMIDQEGGRVARLQPPHWPKFPAGRAFGLMYEREPDWGIDAIKLCARVIAHALTDLGLTINCAPVVDLFDAESSPVIGDRAFSVQPAIVAALARAEAETFMNNGILPVIKHFPGHGRLKVDPHHLLPTIDASIAELEGQDFVPFELLKDLPLGMNSHAIFTQLDPQCPASLSPTIINEIIRGKLGFDGLLLSDDITMKALQGTAADLALGILEAGNDIVLHCSGDTSEMEAISRVLEPMKDVSWARWAHAQAMVVSPNPAYKPDKDVEQLDILLGGFAYEDLG